MKVVVFQSGRLAIFMPQFVKHQSGFTLIEIMVAVSIFTIVATISVSALLTANLVNQKAQAIKLAIDNVNYAIDSMTIKLKRGTAYICASDYCQDTQINFRSPKEPLSGGQGLGYIYTLAYIDPLDPSSRGYIAVTPSNVGQAIPITSPDVDITDFRVIIKDVQAGWPRALIVVRGKVQVGHESHQFALETAVTER